MWRLRRLIRKLRNLIRWLPVIWNDENWDHYYIFEILKKKLIFMSEDIRMNGHHVSAEYDANKMMLCVRLIEKVQNEEYMEVLENDDNLTAEKIDAAYNKQVKARQLLFKLLDQHIEKWWD